MSAWSEAELAEIERHDDLYIAPLRDDGVTHGTPTRIWAVVVDEEVYVRPASGPSSSWYRAAVTQRAGSIQVGELTRHVEFAAADEGVLDAVDAAYAQQYPGSSAVPTMQGAGPRSATVLISPAPQQ